MKSSRNDGGGGEGGGIERWKMTTKKNVQRLGGGGGGGGGLSLEAFANAKSKNNAYNPALLKRKREFYKNAKFVNKYKRMVKQENQETNPSSSAQPSEEKNSGNAGYIQKNKKNIKGSYSLEGLYEKKRQEEEKARMAREAIIKAKKEGIEKAEARRKDLKEKMYKKTRKGQPVMKYRIEHILETLQESSK